MLPLLVITIIASAFPLYNVERGCRIDTDAAGDTSGYQTCVADEKAAKAEVGKEWSHHSTAAQQDCTSEQDGDFGHSYVELMTCFEMQAWKTQLDDVTGSVVAGPRGQSAAIPLQIGVARGVTRRSPSLR